jgi:preprotein translocase subunit SecE
MVNFPKFADFLISVEGEMNKVSWPSKGELIRSSIVVIVVIALLAAVLFFYDIFWQFIFGDRVLGILRSASGN